MAQLLKNDGTIIKLSSEKGEKFSIEELHHLLETGKVDLIPLPNGLKLVIDADSRTTKIRPINRLATLLAREIVAKGPFGFVVGNAVVLEDGEI